jgi:metacaspase-1
MDYSNRLNRILKSRGLLSVALIVFSICATAQTKRGLIVAIGDYPESGQTPDWRDISSVNDIPLVRSALIKQGFTSNNVAVIKDEEATKIGIVNAIQALTKSSNKGDIVIIHFSSHGQQIQDDNGDELDGYDEAIVPYGAPPSFENGYDFSLHLRDDELEELLFDLRKKVGPTGDVILFADACHSGTVTRGEEISRGGMPPMHQPGYKPTRGSGDEGVLGSNNDDKRDLSQLAPLIVISGSQAAKVNHEHNGAGSLSTAISRSVDKINLSTTYRGFFAQIVKEMSLLAPGQKPVIEGNIDRAMFAGKVIEQEPFYKSYKIKDNKAFLYGGKLNGIFEGASIAAYPIGTTSIKNSTPIASGTAINAEGTWCKVELDKELPGSYEDYWFFITEHVYGETTICLKVDIKNKEIREGVKSALSAFPLFHVDADNPDFLIETSAENGINITRVSNGELFAENLPVNNYDTVVKVLQQFSIGNHIKSLELTDSRYHVIFELIPVRFIYTNPEETSTKITDTLTLADITVDGVIVFRESENIGTLIKVTNIGTDTAYFAMVDIQPNGVINGLLPSPYEDEQTPNDYRLLPGQSTIPLYSFVAFYDPYGIEVFKLFASKEQIDFTPILTPKPRMRGRGKEFMVEALFRTSIEVATRGDLNAKVKSSDMESTTSEIGFEIRR